jgi:hypothetical protein
MSVPPRTQRDWETTADQPTASGPHRKPDKLGLALVGAVLLAIVVAAALLIVL